MATGTNQIESYLAKGLAAARPVTPRIAANGTSMYYTTDTNNLYIWNGTGWTTLL